MKIAYLHADLGIPLWGHKGGSIHIRQLCQALAACGHEVTIVTASVGDPKEATMSLRVVPVKETDVHRQVIERIARTEPQDPKHRILAKEYRSLQLNAALEKAVSQCHQKLKFDLIYERYSLWSYVGLELARQFGLPFVLEVNAPLLDEQKRYRKLYLEPIAEAIEALLFHHADAVMVVSDTLRRYVMAKGVPGEKVHVVMNGVDPHLFRRPPKEHRARRERMRQRFTVGFVGGLKKWHNLEMFLESFRILYEKDPTVHLLIIGEGPMRRSLEGCVKKHHLQKWVTWTGALPHSEVPKALLAADVAVAPYSQMDSFYFSPIKLFEYMAMEIPVVASAIGQITEIIQDGKTGLLCAPGDQQEMMEKILHLRKSPALCITLGHNARRLMTRHHTWKHRAQTLTHVMQTCLKGRKKSI